MLSGGWHGGQDDDAGEDTGLEEQEEGAPTKMGRGHQGPKKSGACTVWGAGASSAPAVRGAGREMRGAAGWSSP